MFPMDVACGSGNVGGLAAVARRCSLGASHRGRDAVRCPAPAVDLSGESPSASDTTQKVQP